jgi:hypothetical protein
LSRLEAEEIEKRKLDQAELELQLQKRDQIMQKAAQK